MLPVLLPAGEETRRPASVSRKSASERGWRRWCSGRRTRGNTCWFRGRAVNQRRPARQMSAAGTDGHPEIRHRAGARETRVDVDNASRPVSLAFITQRKPTGCASAMELPSMMMQSAFARSCRGRRRPAPTKGGTQTGHRGGVSYSGLVGHADHARDRR